MTYFDQFGREFKKGTRVLVDRADPNGVLFPGTINGERPLPNGIWSVDLDGWHHFVDVAAEEMVVAVWKYHYCSYWRTWSRILREPAFVGGVLPRGVGPFVEVNLTPIHSFEHDHGGWEFEVKCIRVRSHGTARSHGDKDVDCLPEEVQIKMRESMPFALYAFLTEADILPMIDWEKYNKVCNGGAALADCVVEPLPDDYTEMLAQVGRESWS
jgi:hypothetical protein